MDVGSALVADGEPSDLVDPCEGALDHPAVAAELGRCVDATARDARGDRTGAAFPAAPAMVVGLVGMKLLGPLARTAPLARAHPRHCVQGRGERHAVMAVRARDRQAERRAARVGDRVALRARLAPVGRVRPRRGAPLLAAMVWLSSAARLQSNSPARSSRSSSVRCNRSQTPACCQSRSRRQQVMPEQPNTSRGSISHAMPVRSTNTIPRSAARSGTLGLPPFGFAGSSGSSGSTAAHISSLTSSCLMETESARR